MKPSFALSLSMDGICLLHRAAGGWRVVGEVDPSSDDLRQDLASLRGTAAGLGPNGVTCKLLIPNEQIRYLTIETPESDDAARRMSAERALDGATPYAVEDLVFDICPDGDVTHVAAVAKETLEEAESFAVDHGFDAVSFAAVPGVHPFLGEPWFGETGFAAGLLDPGDSVEPDGVAVVVTGTLDENERVEAQAEPELDFLNAEDEESEATDGIAGEALTGETRARDIPASWQVETEKPATTLVLEHQLTVDPPSDSFIEAADQGFAEPPVQALEIQRQEDKPFPGFSSRRTPEIIRSGPGSSPGSLATTPASAPSLEKPEPPVSLTNARVNGARLDIAEPRVPKPAAAPKTTLLGRQQEPRIEPPAARTFKAVLDAKEPNRPLVAPPKTSSQASGQSFELAAESPRGKPRHFGLILTAILLLVLLGVAAWASVRFDEGLARLFGREPEMAEMAIAVDAEAPVIANAEGIDDAVTASLDTRLSGEDAAVLEALRRPDVALPEPETFLPEESLSSPAGEDNVPSEEDLRTPAVEDPEMIEDRQDADYAVSGIWPMPPDLPSSGVPVAIEDLYMTGIDPVNRVEDAVALPAVARQDTDLAIAVQSSPLAPETRFDLDDRGLVTPTAAGTINPDGITVYLGPPPLVPPAEMAKLEDEPATTGADTALAGTRPRVRPEALIENNERANNDGLTRSELAGLRPKLRPVSEQENALAAASLVPLDTPTDPAVEVDPFATATRHAAKQSRRPDDRPGDFGKIVASARSQAEAERQAEAQQQAEAQRKEEASSKAETQRAQAQTEAEAAADEQDEPVRQASAAVVPRNVTPNIPSSATVSRSATVKNAISLRETSLIGVYGKPSARRALIRLSNGRYQKVKVGDRLDGGRVSAIGDSELMYQKGGRNVVLRMPKT